MVDVGHGGSAEASIVGGAANCLPDSLVVLVLDLDVDLALFVDGVLDVVLAVVGVDDLGLDGLRFFFACLYRDLEVVTARGAVLLVLVPPLDDEFDGLVDAQVV